MNRIQESSPCPSNHRPHGGPRIPNGVLRLLGLLLLFPWCCAQAAESVLETADVRVEPGNRLDISLNFSGQAPQANAFLTSGPDRLVVDLPGAKNGLKQRTQPIQSNLATSLTAIEASDRTRVVVNLNSAVPYEVRTEGSQVLIGINAGSEPRGPATAPVATAAPSERALKPVPAAARSREPSGRDLLRDVNFRRGNSGEGRILIQLPNPSTTVNINERGTHILVDLKNTGVPPRLVRRLDVTDFGTPVVAVETLPKNGNVQIDIQTAGDYEMMSYQAEDLLTIDVRRLSRLEKERAQREKPVYAGDRLSLNFQNIEVRAVLQLLADFTGLNLVASDTVAGNITLRLKNVPWDQALDIILKTKGLSKRQVDNVILIAPTTELAAQEQLELASQQQIQDLAPLRAEYVQVNYAKAAELAKLLKSPDNRLLTDRGAVSVDERTNTLLVQDTAAKLDQVRVLTQRLDVAVRQVLIESRVVIASNDFAKELGVRFGFSRSFNVGDSEVNMGGGRPGYVSGSYLVNKGPFLQDTNGNAFNSGYMINGVEPGIGGAGGVATTAAESLLVNLPARDPAGAINFLVGKVGSYLLQLELSAMQREGKGEIISNPRVVTSNDHKATIKVGQEIPYQDSAASGATTVAFKEAVLQLDVTPHITPDDRINMDLKVTKDNPDWSRQVLGVPPIDTRSVETKVLVDNGETVVLGGVYERDTSKNRESVPFFGDLPLVGNLFRRNIQAELNRELLIFVTPKLMKEQMKVR